MAISITWNTGVIYVPQADLTHLSGTLYELDLDAFRLELKSLEDDEAGMSWPATHTHNTTSTLAGTTFARQIEILAPYTVTFEDGQYGVNLVGANSNLLDRLNRNQVSVASSNSAGLVVVDSGGGGSAPTASQIADAVWDEALSGHVTAGTAGKALGDAPAASAVADAVWDEAIAGHAAAGSTGAALATAAAVSPPSAGAIADAVWDEATSGHATAGTTGAAVTAAGAVSPPSAASIADAVWDEPMAGHTASGTAGDVAVKLALIERILRNKSVTDPSTGVMTVYADDGTTPLLTANVFEDVAGSTPYQGQGANRRDRLT